MSNPFFIRQLPLNAPFCNRRKEMADLLAYAESKNNVVMHSPRRFGKTSLIHRVQKMIADRGGVVIFADFFGVGSVEDVAARMAEAVFTVTRQNDPFWRSAIRFITSFRPLLRPNADGGFDLTVEPAGGKRGLPLLKETLESLGRFIDERDCLVNICLDEFQEIVTLAESRQIEAVMRTEIQKHGASYFFIGSRRRVLNAIFNEDERPFYRSAFDYPLQPLPNDELSGFIREQFAAGGKACGGGEAAEIAHLAENYPYYAQKLAYFVFDRSGTTVNMDEVRLSFVDMLSSEEGVFEEKIQHLPSQQRLFLRALARESTATPYSKEYSQKHRLGSVSALQNAVKQLALIDYIEKDESGAWRLVDPIFREWLTR